MPDSLFFDHPANAPLAQMQSGEDLGLLTLELAASWTDILRELEEAYREIYDQMRELPIDNLQLPRHYLIFDDVNPMLEAEEGEDFSDEDDEQNRGYRTEHLSPIERLEDRLGLHPNTLDLPPPSPKPAEPSLEERLGLPALNPDDSDGLWPDDDDQQLSDVFDGADEEAFSHGVEGEDEMQPLPLGASVLEEQLTGMVTLADRLCQLSAPISPISHRLLMNLPNIGAWLEIMSAPEKIDELLQTDQIPAYMKLMRFQGGKMYHALETAREKLAQWFQDAAPLREWLQSGAVVDMNLHWEESLAEWVPHLHEFDRLYEIHDELQDDVRLMDLLDQLLHYVATPEEQANLYPLALFLTTLYEDPWFLEELVS